MQGGGSVLAKFSSRRDVPTNHFHTDRWADECPTTWLLTVFIQRNVVADFLQVKCDFTRKKAFLRFWAPFGGLGATYDNHLRLTGKHVVDFLLVLNELFSLGVMAEELRRILVENWWFRSNGANWPKISGKRGRPYQPFFFLENFLENLSYGIKIWTDLSSILSQCTHLSDRQTDGRKDSFLVTNPCWHSMQHRKNYSKINFQKLISRKNTKTTVRESVKSVRWGTEWQNSLQW